MTRDGTGATPFQWALGTSPAETEIPTSDPRTGMVWSRRDKDKAFLWGSQLSSKHQVSGRGGYGFLGCPLAEGSFSLQVHSKEGVLSGAQENFLRP